MEWNDVGSWNGLVVRDGLEAWNRLADWIGLDGFGWMGCRCGAST